MGTHGVEGVAGQALGGHQFKKQSILRIEALRIETPPLWSPILQKTFFIQESFFAETNLPK